MMKRLLKQKPNLIILLFLIFTTGCNNVEYKDGYYEKDNVKTYLSLKENESKNVKLETKSLPFVVGVFNNIEISDNTYIPINSIYSDYKSFDIEDIKYIYKLLNIDNYPSICNEPQKNSYSSYYSYTNKEFKEEQKTNLKPSDYNLNELTKAVPYIIAECRMFEFFLKREDKNNKVVLETSGTICITKSNTHLELHNIV